MENDTLVLLGCGKMGSALLNGWLNGGRLAESIVVIEPYPSEWLKNVGVGINQDLDGINPDICVLAVKPQIMGSALPSIERFGNGNTLVLSIAAGTQIMFLEKRFGTATPIVRAMPNTPAAIGCGISAYVGNSMANEHHMCIAKNLLSAVGSTVRLTKESDIDTVTAVSGSGPAYVFHLIETLTQSAMDAGLPADTAQSLAVETVAGAGRLAKESTDSPEQLRINVTSPKGTTAAALEHLMHDNTGLQQLISRSVSAAIERGRELGQEDD